MAVALLFFFILLMSYAVGVHSEVIEANLVTEIGTEQQHLHDDDLLTADEQRGLLYEQKVVVFNKDVEGYETDGKIFVVNGIDFRLDIQNYLKSETEDCFRLIKIRKSIEDDVLDEVKISCEYELPRVMRGSRIRIEAIIFERYSNVVAYVIKDGVCLNRRYQYVESTKTFLKKDILMPVWECNMLSGRSEKERVSGYISGSEPLLPSDIALMDQQIVVLFKGSVKNFNIQKSQSTFSMDVFRVEIKEVLQEDVCIKIVSLWRKDMNSLLDEVRISCKIDGPVITDDEDILFNYGNVIYVKDWSNIVYIIKDGLCIERTYIMVVNQVLQKIEKKIEKHVCYQLTRWNLEERSSPIKLNRSPPPRSLSIPGLMWILTMTPDTTGYTAKKGEYLSLIGIDGLQLSKQYLYRGDEECIRVLGIIVYGVEVERLAVSCGATNDIYIGATGIYYGKAFNFKPMPGTNYFLSLFNVNRDGSCLWITYNVSEGNPEKYYKSKGETVINENCKYLIDGDFLYRQVHGKYELERSFTQKARSCSSLGWFGGITAKMKSYIWKPKKINNEGF